MQHVTGSDDDDDDDDGDDDDLGATNIIKLKNSDASSQ